MRRKKNPVTKLPVKCVRELEEAKKQFSNLGTCIITELLETNKIISAKQTSGAKKAVTEQRKVINKILVNYDLILTRNAVRKTIDGIERNIHFNQIEKITIKNLPLWIKNYPTKGTVATANKIRKKFGLEPFTVDDYVKNPTASYQPEIVRSAIEKELKAIEKGGK